MISRLTNFIFFLFPFFILIQACTTDDGMEPNDGNPQTVDTTFVVVGGVKAQNGNVFPIDYTTATINGNFVQLDDTNFPIENHGHVWSSTNNEPLFDNAEGKTQLGPLGPNDSKSFTSDLENLQPDTRYNYRMYFQSKGSTYYRPPSAFRTSKPKAPDVNLGGVVSCTETSATLDAEITNFNGLKVLQHGHCASTSPNPTINDIVVENGDVEIGTNFSYTSTINNLAPNNTYYIRAYATNAEGTSYSNTEEQVSTKAGPNIILSSCNYQTDNTNQNNQPNPGELVTFDIGLSNIGTLDAPNVTASFSSTSPYVTNISSQQLFGPIATGSNTVERQISVLLSNLIPDNEIISIQITVDDGFSTYAINDCSFSVNSPNLQFNLVQVINESGNGPGAGNGEQNPGETFTYTIQAVNLGSAAADNANIDIDFANNFINTNPGALFSIGPLLSGQSWNGDLEVTIESSTPWNTPVLIDLLLNDGLTEYDTEQISFDVKSPYIITDGLKAYYTFENNAEDQVGNFDGILPNGQQFSQSTPSGVGTSASFNASEIITVPDNPLVNLSNATYNVWLKTLVEGSIFYSGSSDEQFDLVNDEVSYRSSSVRFTNYSVSMGNPPILSNDWVMLTVVMDFSNGSAFLYINGQQQDTRGDFGDITANSNDQFYIGGSSNSSSVEFDGLMDNIRIYNRALAESEITELYNAKQ